MKKAFLQILIFLLTIINCGIAQNMNQRVIMKNTITEKQIDSLDGIDLIHEVFVSIAGKWNNSFKSKSAFVESLPEEQKLVYAIWVLDMNVKNGGFQQYYYNSNGALYDLSANAAKEMEMDKVFEIITNANKIFLKDNSENSEISFSDKQIDELSIFNRQYYQADTDKYIYKSIANYIKTNKAMFITKEN